MRDAEIVPSPRSATDRALFRAAPAAMAVVDGAGRVEEANPALERLLGYGEEGLSGAPLADLADPEDREAVEAALRRARGEEEPAEVEARWRRPRGTVLVLRMTAASIASTEDEDRIVATLADVTAAREAEAELRRERDFAAQAIEALGQGLTITGLDTRIHYANPAFARMVGRTQEELVGATPYELTHPEDRPRLDEARARRRAGETSSYETRLLRPDGTVVHAYVTGVPLLHGGEIAGSIAAISNLTQRKRIEEALRESGARLRTVVENAPVVLFAVDADGVFTLSEGSALAALGLAPGEAVGRTVGELFPGRADLEEEAQRVLGGEARVFTAAFPEVTLEVRTTPVRDASGAPAGAIGVGTDVTERLEAERALQASERRYKELVETASDIIYGADVEGRFTYVNPSATRIVGLPADALVGMHFSELVRPDLREGVVDFYRRQVRERRPESYLELPVLRADGSELWVGQHVRLVEEDGRVAGVRAVARDITERHAAEEDKDRLLALVGHELRTPLTSVRGALGLLAGGRLGDLPDEGRRMVELALRNTARLIRLVDGILDLERLRAGRMELVRERRDAGELAAEALAAVREAAERAGVRLAAEAAGTPVNGDPDGVIRVLVNLLSNAVKFSPPGSGVVVRAAREGDAARFEVEDRGRGIPPDRVERLWERFGQIDVSDARRGGLGLGLAISRGIVERHGGRIGVRSRPGEGSVFWFTVPDAAGGPAA